MELSTFLKSSSPACAYPVSGATHLIESEKYIMQEIAKYYQQNDITVNTVKVHSLTPYGYHKVRTIEVTTSADQSTIQTSVIPPGTNKILPQALLTKTTTIKPAQAYSTEAEQTYTRYIDMHTRTTNVRLNDIPGETLLNLQLFFADKENTELFLELDYISEDTTPDTDKAQDENKAQGIVNIFFISDAFNKDIIDVHKLYYIKQLQTFLHLAGTYYTNLVKVVFLNQANDNVIPELTNYIVSLDEVGNLPDKITSALSRTLRQSFCKPYMEEVSLVLDSDNYPAIEAKIKSIGQQAVAYGDYWTAKRKLEDLYKELAPQVLDELGDFATLDNFNEARFVSICDTLLSRILEHTSYNVRDFYSGKGLRFFTETREELVGADNLIKSIRQIKAIKDNAVKAKELGLSLPTGILLLGRPGTGKTLSVERMRDILGVPAIQFDPESYLNSALGATDQAVLQALKLAGQASGILFIDEIEKFLSTKGNNTHDVTQRIVAIFLRWMESVESKDVIVVATANKPDLLSPELLRRFNLKFLFDLPDANSRQQLITNKLNSYKVEGVTDKDMQLLLENSEGLSGSDINNAISNLVMEEFGNTLTSNISIQALSSKLKGMSLSVQSSPYKEYYSSNEFMDWCNLHYVERAQSYELSLTF